MRPVRLTTKPGPGKVHINHSRVKQKIISNIPQSKNPANVTAINVMSGIYLRCDMLLGLLGMTSRAVNPRDIVVEMVDHKGG